VNRSARSSVGAVVVVALLLTSARGARAFERQQHLGVDGGFTLLNINDKSTSDLGATFGLHYAYGLTDAFNLVAQAQHQIVALNQQLDNPDTPHTRPAFVSSGTIGAEYIFDVLRWVPYVGALAGPYFMGGGTIDNLKVLFGAQLEVGLDFQLTRNLAVGAAYHEHFMLTDMATYPVFFNVLGRVEYVWGW
jgi:Outer membrane protein beta-barrel domain